MSFRRRDPIYVRPDRALEAIERLEQLLPKRRTSAWVHRLRLHVQFDIAKAHGLPPIPTILSAQARAAHGGEMPMRTITIVSDLLPPYSVPDDVLCRVDELLSELGRAYGLDAATVAVCKLRMHDEQPLN